MAREHRIRLNPMFTALLVALIGATFGLATVASDSGSKPSRVSTSKAAGTSSAEMSAAANENERLSTQLNWAFGGKVQHGWYIYRPLISQEVGSDAPVGSAEFARAVAKWQRANGVPATGILDESSWMAMVGDFQNSRLRNKHYADPNELITVPVQEFYDPARPDELREVERDAYAAYQRMIAAAATDNSLGLHTIGSGQLSIDEKFLKIISAFRSREYQEHLRAQSPNSGRAGLAINSPHFTGRALDLYVGGEPVSTKDENRAVQTATPVYQWLVKNAAKFGFKPYFYEPWHWEYVK